VIFKPFTPFVRTQLFAAALGFALALWSANRLELGLRIFLIATAAAWLCWELTLGPSAPLYRSDARALAYGGLSGFAIPWVGFAVTYALDRLQP
jgi:hypothetical protein